MSATLIQNGTLIDGNGGAPVPGGAVLVENGRISAVGRDLPAPPEAEVLDAGGGYILPGFIDCHVHLAMSHFDMMKMMSTPFSLRFYQMIPSLRQMLEAGITSVRDARGLDIGTKQAVEQGLITGPRLQVSVGILTSTSGHGDFWLPSGMSLNLFVPYPGQPGSLVCDGPDEVRKKTREVLRAGAEVIKVCTTGGVGSPTDHPDFTQFTPEELAVIVQEGAYRRGVKVMAHAEGAEGIKNAVRAGIHSIEHGIHLDDEGIALMAERGTFLVPTLAAPTGVLETAEKTKGVPEWAVHKAKETVDAHRRNIGKAFRGGVRIAMGTDAPLAPHGKNLKELGLMCDVGLSPMEAIVAATRTAAECLEWQDRVGTLEPGKLADLVVSRVDPLANIRGLEEPGNIALVMKGGQAVKNLLQL